MKDFPQHEFEQRWERARTLMDQVGLDAILVTERTNYRYFSGSRTIQHNNKQRPMIVLVPKKGEPVMMVYGLEAQLRHALLASALAERRIGPLAAEERAGPRRVPGAAFVVADPSGTGGEERLAHGVERLGGDEDDEFAVHGPTLPQSKQLNPSGQCASVAPTDKGGNS